MTAVVESWHAGPLGVTLRLAWGHSDKPTRVDVWVPWDEWAEMRAVTRPLQDAEQMTMEETT